MKVAIILVLALLAACGSSESASPKPAETKPAETKPAAPAAGAPASAPASAPAPDAAAPLPDAAPIAVVEVPTSADFEDRVRDVTAKNLELHLHELEDELAP